jgi:hypothetical protein
MATGPATYSGNPASSDLDQVRFLLGDTDVSGDNALFSNAEIQWAINSWGPLYGSDFLVAAMLAENAAAAYAQEATYSADGVSVSFGPIGDSLRALALSLRNQYAMSTQAGVMPEAGGMTVGEGKIAGTKNFMFGIGMDDDPSAGQQDWGGDAPRDWPSYGDYAGAPGESGP